MGWQMAVELPQWLDELRRTQVTARVRNDKRSTQGLTLGLRFEEAMGAIDWGQASFDQPWRDLTPADRVLLYAHFNQLGHLEELTEAFRMIFKDGPPPNDPILVDLGCGPCTGGLAFASASRGKPRFDYIGLDTSSAMRDFGERLAASTSQLTHVSRQWARDITSVAWERAPGWRPVFVVASFLLASPTVNATQLVCQLNALLAKLGNGPATVLYTNSSRPDANRHFPAFDKALRDAGFDLRADGVGEIVVGRWVGKRLRKLRYSLFHRPAVTRLRLGDS